MSGFGGDGIHVEGDHAANPSTNANGWQVANVRVDGCGGDALFVRGKDANAGCAVALDTGDNGGWGVNDESFLGNTYVACQAANNKAGGYRVADRNARSLFLNCYSENGQRSAITAPSIVLGGVMDVDGSAIWLDQDAFVATFRNSVRGLSPARPGQPFADAGAYLGSVNVPGVALELHHIDPNAHLDPGPYRFHYGHQHAGWWELIYAGLDGGTPLRFSTKDAPEGWGRLWLENGCYLGTGANRLQVQTGATPPTAGAWQKGDRVLNADPAPGDPARGWAGWICTQAGTPGAWKPFGAIAP